MQEREIKITFTKDLKKHFLSIIKKLDHLKQIALSIYEDSFYKDSDLRKTTFIKMNQLFTNFLITVITAARDDSIEILSDFKINSCPVNIKGFHSKHLAKYFVSGYRTLYTESIELLDNFLKPIYDTFNQKKTFYIPFSYILTYFQKKKILNTQEYEFLKEWLNNRNTRHRNYVDFKKNEPNILKLSLTDLKFEKFDTLLNLFNKIISHQEVKKIPFIEDLVI